MSRDPVRPADLLKGILREAGVTPERAKVRSAVEQTLGETKAAAVSVKSFRAGRLVLEVESSALFSELRGFGQDSLRTGINRILERDAVQQISFRMGGTGYA